MRSIFLSPHNDDETLFGAFTLLRYNPLVVICLQSRTQEIRGEGVTDAERNLETAQAMSALNVREYKFLRQFDDYRPDWSSLFNVLLALVAEQETLLFAPAVEEGGHPQHNEIGRLAEDLGAKRLVQYMTYTSNGKSRGRLKVPFEPTWPLLKLEALAQYKTQITRTLYVDHFLREQYEYYA